MTEHKHVARRQNPNMGRGVSREVARDEQAQTIYCTCPDCGSRTQKKIGLDCSAVRCIKCGTPMA